MAWWGESVAHRRHTSAAHSTRKLISPHCLRSRRRKRFCVLHPHSTVRLGWDVLMLALVSVPESSAVLKSAA